MRIVIALMAGCALVLSACGTPQNDSSSPEEAPQGAVERPSLPMDYWQQPLGNDAPKLSRPEDADLAYRPLVAEDLGPPRDTFASAKNERERQRQIAWTFAESPHSDGPFVLIEEPTFKEVWAENVIGASASPGCQVLEASPGLESDDDYTYDTYKHCVEEGWSVGSLSDGTEVIVAETSQFISVIWAEPISIRNEQAFRDINNPVLNVTVSGPPDSFSLDEAFDIAELIHKEGRTP